METTLDGMSTSSPRSVDLARIARLHVALLAILAGLGAVTGWMEPGSLVLGGAVMGFNVWLLKIATNVLIAGGSDSVNSASSALAVGALILHFGILLGLSASLMWRFPIDAAAFAVGITVLLVACVIEAVHADRRGRKGER